MRQSRLMPLVEAVANVAVGYGVAVVTQLAVFPMFGLDASIAQNLDGGHLSRTKAGVEALTHILSLELGKRGITVNAVFFDFCQCPLIGGCARLCRVRADEGVANEIKRHYIRPQQDPRWLPRTRAH